MPTSRPAALVTALMALLAGCGSGATGASPPGQTTTVLADVLVRGERSSDLLSLSIIVDELRVLDGAGAPGENLLTGPAPVEWIGSGGSARWLARGQLQLSGASGLRLVFDPASAVARDPFGANLDVTVVSPVWEVPLTTPIATTDPLRLVLDLDLRTSVQTRLGPPVELDFDPDGRLLVESTHSAREVDEVKGLTRSIFAADHSFTIDAYVDDDGQIALGRTTVRTTPATWLVDETGTLFLDEDAFYAALQSGQTLVEVHGALGPNGKFDTTRVEIEDHSAGATTAQTVEVEGLILNLGIGFFDLELREIEKGVSIAAPVIASLGDPPTLSVSFDIPTRIFDRDGSPVGISSLFVGQEVDVEFPLFATQPFLASEIEVQRAAQLTGVIHDGSSLPGALVMHPAAGDPAVLSGTIASTTTDTLIGLAQSEVTLLTRERAVLDAGQLLRGLGLVIEGPISGPPSAPTLDAQQVWVLPGRLAGFVSGTDEASNTFDATVTSIAVPFGDPTGSPPFAVRINPGATFDGAAMGPEAFFDLFGDLQPGQVLGIELEGMGSGAPNEILAFHITTLVQ